MKTTQLSMAAWILNKPCTIPQKWKFERLDKCCKGGMSYSYNIYVRNVAMFITHLEFQRHKEITMMIAHRQIVSQSWKI